MSMICFNLMDFSRLYHSLIDMCGLSESESLNLVYDLNTANIDTIRNLSGRAVRECSYITFTRLVRRIGRPYSNLLTLYESMDFLDDSIHDGYLTDGQKTARARLRTLMRDIRYSYSRYYGIDLDEAMLVCDKGKQRLYIV